MVCNLLERAGAGKSETRETLFTLHALFAQVERLEQERDEARDGLVTLRGAWNAHMARCDLDAERQAEINRFVPTFEQIQAWANAPSDTASAAPCVSFGARRDEAVARAEAAEARAVQAERERDELLIERAEWDSWQIHAEFCQRELRRIQWKVLTRLVETPEGEGR